MKYWDSSAVVPLLVEEELSKVATRRLKADAAVITWWATPVECVSAVSRREREGTMTAADAQQAIRTLMLLREGWTEIEPSHQVREGAIRLLRMHPLRAADALQLSAAIAVRDSSVPSLPFVCCDERLRRAAEKEGFEVVMLDGDER